MRLHPETPQPNGLPLRVLHLVRPASGGIVSHAAALCEALTFLGVECSIAAPRRTFGLVPHVELNNVPIAATSNPFRDVQAALLTARLARQVDIIHGHGARAGWIAYLATRLVHKPYCVTLHNMAPASVARTAVAGARAMLRYAAQTITVSQAVADSWARYGLNATRTTVVPNGVNVTRFERMPLRDTARELLGLPQTAFVVGAIGRLAPEKGFDLLIEAWVKVSQKHYNAQLAIAGAGQEEERLRAHVERLHLGDSVTFAGHLPDVRVLLEAADLLCVPSRTEGQGIAALEAMAAGLPVVAFAVGGLCEVVRDHETGLLVPANSFQALADALDYALANPIAMEQMGRAGRLLARKKYQVEDMGCKTLQLYRRVLDR